MMDIKEFLNNRLYLIVGILAILPFFLPILNSTSISKIGGNDHYYSFVMMFYIEDGAFNSLFDDMGSYWFNTVIPVLFLFIGIALLIVSGILINKERIQKVLPAIGISLVMFALILSYLTWSLEFGLSIPFYYYESSTRIYTNIAGISTWIVSISCAIASYKYLFSKN